jgi:dCMP deaminase
VKEKFVKAYMDTAKCFAKLSSARRLHVGAIVVKDDRIISIGYNGMPAGWDNNCEDETIDDRWYVTLKTKPEVLHAETNAIAKLARSNDSGLGADLFVTHSPCLECAKLIYQSGISRVWFGQAYRDDAGIDFLKKSGIEVNSLESKNDNSAI